MSRNDDRIFCMGRLSSETTEVRFRVDSAAADAYGIDVISASGSSAVMQALRAHLHTGTGSVFFDTPLLPYETANYSSRKYEVKMARIGMDMWHLVGIAKHPGLVLDESDDALWQQLQHHTTTPIVRSWVPYIRQQLPLYGMEPRIKKRFRSEAMVYTFQQSDMDRLVCDGIKKNELSIAGVYHKDVANLFAGSITPPPADDDEEIYYEDEQYQFPGASFIPRPIFELGEVMMTGLIAASLDREVIWDFLVRHARGDWSEMSPTDAEENAKSLSNGCRIFSAYKCESRRVWIITEADRSRTTVLFPEEY